MFQFGSNPAGVTTSLPRRLEILRLARKFDLIILEDDPYYFLYYGDGPKPTSYFALDKLDKSAHVVSCSSAHATDEGADGVHEVDARVGRVLRMDSFSKIISAGLRLGWVTGPDIFVRAIENHVSAVSSAILNPLHQTYSTSSISRTRQRSSSPLRSPKWLF